VIDTYTSLFFSLFDFRIIDCFTDCDPTPVLGPVAELPEVHETLLVN
jgi:hypothetical protein